MYPSEKEFTKFLEKHGKSWIYEPRSFDILGMKYYPDFYCPEDKKYYEVNNSKSILQNSRWKYILFLKLYPSLKFELVRPNGEKIKNWKRPIKSIGFFVRIPISWTDKIKKIAQAEARTDASVVRHAIKLFLEGKK